MSKGRKTFEVQLMKEFANKQLANPKLTRDEKLGIIMMIQELLHRTNNYKGFIFLFDGENELDSYEWTCRTYL